MSHTFHCHLRKSFRWYHNWHNHPNHQHTHWSVLIIIALSIFSFISGSVGDFYFEDKAKAAAGSSQLLSGENLLTGQNLRSTNGAYSLDLQGDGNLVLYRLSNNSVLWATNTNTGNELDMQGDGNLVLYNSGGGVSWASNTSGNGATLELQNDGNLVIYFNGSPLWSTGPDPSPQSPSLPDPIDLNNVTWISPNPDISSWPKTATLGPVSISGRTINLPYDKTNSWPLSQVWPEWTPPSIVGMAWIFVYQDNTWYATTWEYLGQGQTQKDTSNITDACGVLKGPLSNYTPDANEVVGFMVSTVPDFGGRIVDGLEERSNIVMTTWTGATGSSGDNCTGTTTNNVDLSQPNNTFYQLLSQYTNAAKSRNIYTLLAAYNMWLDDSDGWLLNPFNPANNVNPETDSLTSPDLFIQELGRAVNGDTSTTTRQFLRNVWQTFITKLSQNTPDTVLFQPFSEDFKDAGQFDKNGFLNQAYQWWGKGKMVDNTESLTQAIHPLAIYRDWHNNNNDPNFLNSKTIVNTDVNCQPPSDATITNMSQQAKARNSNYLVYDCASPSSWQTRVISSLNTALGGIQPNVIMGQGTLIGYGGSDFWVYITKTGSYISFLDQLKNAGANLTFALAVINPDRDAVTELPWVESDVIPPQGNIALGISGDRFTVNGNSQFLLFASYFGAMAASDATLDSDFAALKSRGFNGIRIFPNWWDNPQFQLMDSAGNLKPGMLNRLTNVLNKAQNNSLAVDVSFAREVVGADLNSFRNGIQSTTSGILSYRGVTFDLQNEVDLTGRPTQGLSPAEVLTLRNAVKAIDPNRLVTASALNTSYLNGANLDFWAPHDPRSGDWPGNTDNFVISTRASLPRSVPIYLQEPERYRGTAPYSDSSDDWLTAAKNAKCAGAAGWTFHNAAGYDLAVGSMFSQFNSIENQIVNGLSSQLNSTGWFSCSGTSPPPPPGSPPYGCFQGNCPAGYIAIGGANASSVDLTETDGYFCDDDGIFPDISGLTFPVTAQLACGGNSGGTAFIAGSGAWPCNAGRPNNPGWEFIDGRPYKNGFPVQLIAEMSCSDGPVSFNLSSDNFTAGAWTTNPSIAGDVCVQGTILPASDPACGGTLPPPPPPSGPPPRYLYYIAPDLAPVGSTIVLAGDNLTANVKFKNSSGNTTAITGIVDQYFQETTIVLPSSLTPGIYSVKIVSDPDSNEVPFEVKSGFGTPSPTGYEPPIITSIEPLTVSQGGTIEIFGEYLTSDIEFAEINGGIANTAGFVSDDAKIVTVTITEDMPPGLYNVSVISPYGTATSPDVVTVIEGQIPPQPQTQEISPPPATNFGELFKSIFNYSLITVGIAVFIMILWGGFLWLTSAANPGNIATAKRYITNAILGVILLLSAYVILYTINPELVGGEFMLERLKEPPTLPIPPGSPGSGTIDACTACSAYPGGITAGNNSIQCMGYYVNSLNFDPSIPNNNQFPPNPPRTCPFVELLTGQSLVTLRQLAANWVLSEGFPPTVNHADFCHGNGTCVDIVLTPRPTGALQLAEALDNLCNLADQAGFSSITNEYTTLSGYPYSWRYCRQPKSTPFATGEHLHLEK